VKYVFDEDAENPVEDGPEGNYVYDSQVAPPPPPGIVAVSPWGWNRTETLGYDAENNIWYAGVREHYLVGEVLKYEGSQGPSGQWESAFTYQPMDVWDHHDGLEFINGRVYVSDMFGDNVLEFSPDGTLLNIFSHLPFLYELESMGWGALEHFWSGTFSMYVTEFGGGALQYSVEGGVARPVTPPVHVEKGCTLYGWEPYDANDFLTWDVNSWTDDTNNIDADPLFVAGYYLSYVDAGQEANSPCVDWGSGDANEPNIAMDTYTTRMDGVNDTGPVDMGYHYSEGLIWHWLTISVVDANGDPVDPNDAHGYVDPNGSIKVYEGFTENPVPLMAYPDANYLVKAWHGTDDDNSVDPNNYVTVVTDQNAGVEFVHKPVYTLTVSVVDGNGLFLVDPNINPVTYFEDSYVEDTTVTLRALTT
jgi:hypothetical protein